MNDTEQRATTASRELVTIAGVHPETAELIQRLLSKRNGRLPRGFESALRGYGNPADDVDADSPDDAQLQPQSWEELFKLVALTAGCIPQASPDENSHVVRVVRQLKTLATPETTAAYANHEQMMAAMGRVFAVLVEHFGTAVDMKADVVSEVERLVKDLQSKNENLQRILKQAIDASMEASRTGANAARYKALEELVQQAQALGLGY